MARRDREEVKQDDGINSKLVAVNRITKVVKGGRIMRFAALVAVGDGKGRVGIGTGKAKEVPEAIKKAELIARRQMIRVPVGEFTIPHNVQGKFGKSTVLMKPAPEGNGIIAGGSVRAIVELAGIKNITTKTFRATPSTPSARRWTGSCSSVLPSRSRLSAARPWKRSRREVTHGR